MIVMYPMLVSTTVSSDILPAISKVLEKFILLYRMESISSRLSYLDKAGVVAGIAGRALGGAALLASKQYEEPNVLSEVDDFENKWSKRHESPDSGVVKGLKKARDVAIHIAGDAGEKRGVHFERPRNESLALEPTYVEMQSPKIGTIIVGVKVLPFTVSSEYNLLYYLSHDMSSNWIEGELKSRWRKYGRMAWAILRAIKLPIIGAPFRRAITGDPQKDIAFASTVFKHNVFCLINYNDSISEMVKNPGTLRKMYKLGWNSLVFADDINRKATFCMQEFQGLCSTIPYSVMGSSFGKDYQEVFKSMEEVKKASASFFSVKKPVAGLFSEHFTLDKYLDVMQEEVKEQVVGGPAIPLVTPPPKPKPVGLTVAAKKIKKKPGQQHIDEEGKKEDEKSEGQIALL